jgi:hypothetical protein
MRSRRVELICGILGGVLGLIALGVVLFAPLTLVCADAPPPHPRGGCFHVSAVARYGLASQAVGIAIFGGLSLGIILFTLWHVRSMRPLGLVLLWVCAVLLSFLTLISLANIGLVFVPTDALALAASIAGTRAGRQRAPADL